MVNAIKSATTVSNGTLKKNNFLIGIDTSIEYGPTSLTNFWNGITPSTDGYVVYEQKVSQGPSIRTALTDAELVTIATQYGGTNINTVYDALNYLNNQTNYMVTNIDYPNIVTSGLTLNIDGGYIPSYYRTGTTWTDISGSGNTATLVNGPMYNNQAILFDGISDYSTISSGLLTNIYTISIWFTPLSMGTTNTLWSEGNTGLKIRFSGTQLDYNYSSGGVLSGACSLSNLNWYNVVVTSDGSTVSTYLNNSLLSSTSASAENPTGAFQIATDLSNNYYNGKIAQLGVYNRVLSSTELTQNYNSMSYRYTGSTSSYYYYGGTYTTVNPNPAPYLTLLSSGGTKDATFNIGAGFSATIFSTSIQSDGKIVVGGSFSAFSGGSQNYLIRLNSDGSKDTTFNIGTGFNGGLLSTSIQSDGKILVGGSFSAFSGSSQNRLIRLNSDGSKDTTFDIGTGFDGLCYTSPIQSDGKIVVGGSFSAFTGTAQYSLIRLNSDGSKDTTFNIGTGFNNQIRTVSIQSDGKILAGGLFSTFSGSSQNRLIRLNSDGSKDTTFNIGAGFSANIYTTLVQSDGKILVGGQFTTFSGGSQNYLIRLNSNGSKDTTFNIGTGFDNQIRTLSIQSDGKILAGGQFSLFSGSSQNKLIRLNSDGSKDTTFNIGNGFNDINYTTSIQSDGKILTGGAFTAFSGVTQNNFIRVNSDLITINENFNIGTGFNDGVLSTSIQSDGKILAGGQFTAFTGSSQNRLIRLNSDGSKDTTFNIGTGFNNTILSTIVQSDGKILAGGAFTTFSGGSQNYLIRLNSDGSKDTTFNIGTGFNDYIYSMLVQSDGKILVGGQFSAFTGTVQNYLIRLNSDGSKDTTFNIGTGFNDGIRGLSIQPDGKILVSGQFTTFTGSSQNRLIRLNSDGSKDTTFNIGAGFNASVYTTLVQSDGKILAAGLFTTFTGSSQNYLIRLNSDGSKDTTFNIGTGFNNSIRTISLKGDKYLIGGNFTSYKNNPTLYSLLLNNDATLNDTPITFNNGIVTINFL